MLSKSELLVTKTIIRSWPLAIIENIKLSKAHGTNLYIVILRKNYGHLYLFTQRPSESF